MTGGVLPSMPELRASLSDGQHVSFVPVIEYQGKIWIVPAWRISDPPGYVKPERLIRIDNLPSYRDMRGTPNPPVQFAVRAPIPTGVLTGPLHRQKQSDMKW